VTLDDLVHDGANFRARLVDEVGVVGADHRLVGRHLDDVELVDLVKSAASVSAVRSCASLWYSGRDFER